MSKTSPFGEWLRKWRKARGLTQVQLAKSAECAQSTVSELERGERQEVGGEYMRPDTDLVERLATALNRPVEEARLLAGYNPSPVPVTLREIDRVMENNPGGGVYITEQGAAPITADLMREFISAVQKMTELSKANNEK